MLFKTARIGRSVALNWLSLAISVAITFFLSPFVVHRLGNVGYGLWTLINSMVSYMGLLDLGLRGAVTRFVSKYRARGEHAESSQAVSAAFWLRFGIGISIVLISFIAPRLVISAFKIAPEMQSATRWTMAITGTNFAVALAMGVFSAVLVALQRFDIVASVTMVQTIVRASGVLWLLSSGHGLVSLALWELLVVVLGNTALMTFAFRVYRELNLLFRRPDPNTLRLLWSYSFYVLLFHICAQVVYYTDNLVVGATISVSAVTFFTIAGGLLEYARQVVSAVGTVIFPLASSLDAEGRATDLQTLLIQGTRAMLLIALPIQVVLFFHGHTFISLWVGEEYGSVSGRVLQILAVAHAFVIANYTSYNIVWGIGKHKPVAQIAMLEAAANLGLSVTLARRMGITGVAWGTVIPSVALQIFFWPRYICKVLQMPLWRYISEGWIRPAIAVIPFALACYLASFSDPPANLLSFVIQISTLLPALLPGILICFSKQLYTVLRQMYARSET